MGISPPPPSPRKLGTETRNQLARIYAAAFKAAREANGATVYSAQREAQAACYDFRKMILDMEQ